MATITKDQINKLNAKCENGFHFDLQFFCFHKEKTFEKYIPVGENQFLRAHIMYCEKWDHENRKKLNIPTIHLAMYNKGRIDGVLVSYGVGYFIDISEPVERKNTNLLLEFTKRFDDEKVMKMYEDSKNK